MILYQANGQPFDTEPNAVSIKAENTGYKYYPNSFFKVQKSATGDGTSRKVGIGGVGFPVSKAGNTFKAFFGIVVECTADCSIRLYNTSSFSVNNPSVVRNETIAIAQISANTPTYICGIIDKTTTNADASRAFAVIAEFEDAESANNQTLTVSKGVCFDASEVFGNNVPDAETIAYLLSFYTDCYITGESELWSNKIANAMATRTYLRQDSPTKNAYARTNDNGQFEAGGAINPNWEGWRLAQNSYGNTPSMCPIPNQFHGKINTDAQVSVVPLYSHWGRLAVNAGGGDWGGHVFHGWNDAMTYRLTMMASGGMTSPDSAFKPREDEFCIHVFSPDGAYDNPVDITESEAENRITREQEDRFSSNAYFGRIRIGADRTDEGFLFRAKSLKCFGDVDINGKKFLLGASANVPASASASGKAGQIAYDSNYIYICVEDNIWKRIALTSW